MPRPHLSHVLVLVLASIACALAYAPAAFAEATMGEGLAEPDPTGIVEISTATGFNGRHTLAVKGDGTVWA